MDCIRLYPGTEHTGSRGPRPRILRSNVPGATVRDASEDDATACAAIYAPYVHETAVSFEDEPPSPPQMAERIAAATRAHAWVVLEDDDRLVGYAYGGPHQKRAAYRFSCEVSVYVEQGRRRTGSGRALYEALFKRLAASGYQMAVAGMTLPNEASVGLHRAMGFEPVGIYRRIGWKFGAWHDVAWTQRALGVEQDPPPSRAEATRRTPERRIASVGFLPCQDGCAAWSGWCFSVCELVCEAL